MFVSHNDCTAGCSDKWNNNKYPDFWYKDKETEALTRSDKEKLLVVVNEADNKPLVFYV